MIDVFHLYFQWGKNPLFSDLSFSVKKGQIVAILGPSGCGKSTLFRILSGLLQGFKGLIRINGHLFQNAQKQITMMSQEDFFLPWRSCVENILLISELENVAPDKEKASSLLFDVGLNHCHDLYPYQLSGGMKKRLAFARALYSNRPILLLDEPFVSVDTEIKKELYILVKDLSQKHKRTVLFTTHDERDKNALADQSYTIENHQIYPERFYEQA